VVGLRNTTLLMAHHRRKCSHTIIGRHGACDENQIRL